MKMVPSNMILLGQFNRLGGNFLCKRMIHLTKCNSANAVDKIKNFDDFTYPNQVTTFEHYKMPQPLLDDEFNYPVCRDTMGIRWPGYWFKRRFVYVKEMEPQLVVPNLDGFELKPYVSYRTEEMEVEPLTAKALFDQLYAPRIEHDFKDKGLDNYEVSQEDIDSARLKALQTGADLFEEYTVEGVRKPVEFDE